MESDFFPQGNSNFVPDSDTDIVITPMPCESLNVSVLSNCGAKNTTVEIVGSYENSGVNDYGVSYFTKVDNNSLLLTYDYSEKVRKI